MARAASSCLGMIAPLPIEGAARHKVVSQPLRFGGERLMAPRPPPALGDATREVLAQAGVSPSELADLTRAGVIFDAQSPRID